MRGAIVLYAAVTLAILHPFYDQVMHTFFHPSRLFGRPAATGRRRHPGEAPRFRYYLPQAGHFLCLSRGGSPDKFSRKVVGSKKSAGYSKQAIQTGLGRIS